MTKSETALDNISANLNNNPTELSICTAACLITDDTTAFIGTGIPMLAASLAQKMHAPNLVTIFEFGGTGGILDVLPLAVGGENTFHRAVAASGICDIVETAQRGFIEYGFLGCAQVDPYGNLNSAIIGNNYHPRVRFPGSGGANDVGSHCWKTIVIMRHDQNRFVRKVDFVTTPGYLDGPGGRERAGLPSGSGPFCLVSNFAVIGCHLDNKRMMLLALQPGVTVKQVLENTGFELLIAPEITENPPPSAEELDILRKEVDKDRLYI